MMYNTKDEFLKLIKKELKGCDRALIQDALSDAEEHLNTAVENLMQNNSEISYQEAFISACDDYGDISEVAAEYKKMENKYQPVFVEVKNGSKSWLSKFFLIISDPRAWTSSLYMILSIITGIVYGTWVICGLSVSIPLLIFIIGLPIAGFFLLSIRGIALLEGRLVELFLGIRMPRKPMFMNKGQGWWSKFKDLVKARITWKAMIYMILQMPLGIIYFSLFITLFIVSIALIAAPIVELIFHLPMEINGTDQYMPKWFLPFLPFAGVIFLLLTLHLAKFIGKMHGLFAKLMLVKK